MRKPLHTVRQLALVLMLGLSSTLSFGQGKAIPERKQLPAAAVEHIKNNKQKLELTDEDIADLELSSETDSKKSGVKHLYIKQLYQGIEIHGAITNISLGKEDKVIAMGNRFHKEVGKKVKGKQAGLDAEAAVAAAARYLKTSIKEPLAVKERGNGVNKKVLFTDGGISLEPIPAKLVYQPMEDGSLVLAWEVSIYELDAQNWWNIRLDASTGKVLDKDNMVIHCQFDNDGPGGVALHENHSHSTMSAYVANTITEAAGTAATSGYNVFAMPFESPSHGPRAILSPSAADQTASPQGWHYTPIGNMTTTRGNNVYAYEDPNGLNPFPTIANNFTVNNYSPDGGAELKFDFPIDFTKQPDTYVDAATTNLFYWSNIIHDVWYQYGFDEVSGNFQFDNFGKGGAGNDFVRAEAQDARITSATGPQRNNANFGTPADGALPRMQMYLWSGIPDKDMFRVTSPASITGSYPAVEAVWSKKLTSTPLTGKLVVAETADANSAEGCSAYINTGAVAGNIAVVYRGTCGFAIKAEQAQAAGAIALIVVNNAPGAPSSMGGTPSVKIEIPAVMISQADGKTIHDLLKTGVEVSISLKNDGSGPEIDGDFDNGIIAHEYGHGISNRLAGGPSVANCLNNAEQMGEGWSDWFGLMMTMKPGDTAGKVRGIGTYAQGQATNGRGIRPAPYSTDFAINPYTYAATNNPAIAQPHGIGFVWSTMLWDMTWVLIEKYGFDEDLYNGNGGNNMAMQLVIDGLKLQPCRPGFVDGRDAILLADRINYGGANQELIWRAFAKRGLGFSAKQGLTTSRSDQEEASDLPTSYMCTIPLTVAAIPTSNVYTGGDSKVIYLGYGPQTVKLQAEGDATNKYTWSPAAGLSTTAKGTIFTPTAAGTYTFTVTAVNADQCTKTASITITVVDVRCGDAKKVNQVLVCVDGVDECVAPQSVDKLLKQAGGKLGGCNNLAASAVSAAKAAEGRGNLQEDLISSYPNPFSESTTIRFTAKENGYTSLKVYDITGREVATLFDGNAEVGVTYTQDFKASNKQAGVYIYRLVNGGTAKSGTMLLVK